MQTLAEKVQTLRLHAYKAVKLVQFWESALKEHGELRAEQFYLHLGLNHIQRKGVEWEGLTLSREPTEAEKIAVKGVSVTQESAKEAINKTLLKLRTELIDDGLHQIAKLEPSEYHALILEAPKDLEKELRGKLSAIHKQGRQLVANELGKKDALPDYDDEELDTLTGLTNARVANDVQSRIADAAARHRQAGLEGDELMVAIADEISGGSVSYIDRASIGLGNKVIGLGRSWEAQRRSDSWGRVEYSALLDNNVCGPCASEDGKTANSEDDLQPAPNPECEGSDYCRCFHVYINQ